MNAITAASRNESLRRSPLLLRRKFPRRPTLTLDGNGNLIPGVYTPGDEHEAQKTFKKKEKPFVKKIVDDADAEETTSMCTVSTAGETSTTTAYSLGLTPIPTSTTPTPLYKPSKTTATTATSSPVVKHKAKQQQQQQQHMPLMNFSDFVQAPLPSAVEREKQALSNEKKAISAAVAAKKQSNNGATAKKKQPESKSKNESSSAEKYTLTEKRALSKTSNGNSANATPAKQKLQQQPTRHMPLMNLSDFSSSLSCPKVSPAKQEQEEEENVMTRHWKGSSSFDPSLIWSHDNDDEEEEEEEILLTRTSDDMEAATTSYQQNKQQPAASSSTNNNNSTVPLDARTRGKIIATRRPTLALNAKGNLVPTSTLTKKENEQDSHQQAATSSMTAKNTTATTSAGCPAARPSSLSSVKERRELAQQWYARFGRPSRDEMKRRISQMKFCGIAARDVNLLPWTADGSTMVDGGSATTTVVKVDNRDDHHRTARSRSTCSDRITPSLIRSTSYASESSSSVPWTNVTLKKTGIKVVEQPRDEGTNKIVAKGVQSSHRLPGKLKETTEKGEETARRSTTRTPQRCKSTSASVAAVKKEVVAPNKTVSPKNKARIVDDDDDDDDDDSDKSIELTYLYEPRSPKASSTYSNPTSPIVVVVSKHNDTRSRVHDSKNDKTKTNKHANQRSKNQHQPKKCIYLPPSCKLLATGGRNKMTIARSTNDSNKDDATTANAPSPSVPSSSSCITSAPKGLVLNSKGDLVSPPATGATTESSNESIGTSSSSNNPWARVKLKKTLSNDSPAAFKDMMRRAGKKPTSEVGGGALW